MLVINELKNGDSVIYLKAKGVKKVVHDDHVFELSILDDPEVLYEEPIFCLHAVLSGQDV